MELLKKGVVCCEPDELRGIYRIRLAATKSKSSQESS